jgi:hypothetical protein
MSNKKRPDPGSIAKKQKFHVGPLLQRTRGTWNDHFGSMVAAHGVKGNSYWLNHGLRNSGPARQGTMICTGKSVMDDWFRKIISIRRQQDNEVAPGPSMTKSGRSK